jgi:hypothetical protein
VIFQDRDDRPELPIADVAHASQVQRAHDLKRLLVYIEKTAHEDRSLAGGALGFTAPCCHQHLIKRKDAEGGQDERRAVREGGRAKSCAMEKASHHSERRRD